jgi:hypothetical protein
MKALAARTRDGLRLLADIIGVDSAAMALQICADFFPEEDIRPRSAAILQELFGVPGACGELQHFSRVGLPL